MSQNSFIDLSFGGQVNLNGLGQKIQEELIKLGEYDVLVGYVRGVSPYPAEGGDEPADLVDVAAYNEFGTSTIPPRPFMKQGIENHGDTISKVAEYEMKKVINGGNAGDALNMLGIAGKAAIQEEIATGIFAPNAPSTIRKKKSSRPLIDTGHMRQNVQYYIRKKGESK